MQIIKGIAAVFIKDIQTELRTRYAINTVLAFVGAALLLVLYALGADRLPPESKSGLVWVIILFAALSGLSRSFVKETDGATYDLLRLHGSAAEVFLGKLLYNFVFTFSVNLATFLLYIFLLRLPVVDLLAFSLVLTMGTAGLSGVSTLLAAMVSQADRKGAIFSVLGIPLLFPLILILVRTTKAALIEGLTQSYIQDFWAMAGYAGATITAGFLLFDYIWEE